MSRPTLPVVINTLPLKIMMCFDEPAKINKSGELMNANEFTFANIADNPDLANHTKASVYKYPYFANNIKYPIRPLINLPANSVIDIFFDETNFEEFMIKYSVDTYTTNKDPEYKDKIHEYTIFNITLMLQLLLSVGSDFGYTVTSSYHTEIERKYFSQIMPTSMRDVKQMFYNPPTILTHNSTKYYIGRTQWASNILDNPYYYRMIMMYNIVMEKRKILIPVAEELLIERARLFFVELNQKKVKDKNILETLYESLTKQYNIIKGNEYSTSKNLLGNSINLIHAYTEGMPTPTDMMELITILLNEVTQSKPNKDVVVVNDKIVEFLANPENREHLMILADVLIKLYPPIVEYQSTSDRSNRVMDPLNLDANVLNMLEAVYKNAIAIKACVQIQRFVTGVDQTLNLNKKVKDKDKSRAEVDIIEFIMKQNKQYKDISDEISKTVNDVIPPTRSTSNVDLQKEIMQIKESGEKVSDKPLYKQDDECVAVEKEGNFFTDVYYKYFRGQEKLIDIKSIYTKMMFTGVQTINIPTGQFYEIFVILDLLKKDIYDNSDGVSCAIKDDNISNLLINLITTKTTGRVIENPKTTFNSLKPRNKEKKSLSQEIYRLLGIELPTQFSGESGETPPPPPPPPSLQPQQQRQPQQGQQPGQQQRQPQQGQQQQQQGQPRRGGKNLTRKQYRHINNFPIS